MPAVASPTLSPDQVTRLGHTVAEFNSEQLLWASGYLAGLAARGTPLRALTPTPNKDEGTRAGRGLSIFFGSQTGNSRRVAEQLHQQALRHGIGSRLINLADFVPRAIKDEQQALFVLSTQGDGDPPEDATALFDYVKSANAPKLPKLKFSVLALGDSSYPYFCQAGRLLDERLAELGAERVLARVDCDLDFAANAAQWSEQVLARAQDALKASVPRIAIVDNAIRPAGPLHTRVKAELLVNQRLTGRASSKDVRHLEFAFAESAFHYEPGDGIALLPRNPAVAVCDLLDALRWSGSEQVSGPRGAARELASVLTEEVEITRLSRQFLVAWQHEAPQPALAELLETANGAAFARYLEAHQVADVVREFPAAMTPQTFVNALRPLVRRTYSVASSLEASPGEAHVLVAKVVGAGPHGPHYGAASNYLADLGAGTELELHLEANEQFHLPSDDAAPMIMIGPGTGVAPFRGFVAARAARGARGRNWLLFGERTQREDFLYQIEWHKALLHGHLHRMDVAFSRDQSSKVYVQDRLREHAKECFAWLEEGAYLYVCGDAKHMAKDVHETLLEVIRRGLGRDEEHAREYLQELKRQGRYRRDVY